MNANRKKNIAVIACVLFVFVTLASLFYIAKEENHQCTGILATGCLCVLCITLVSQKVRLDS